MAKWANTSNLNPSTRTALLAFRKADLPAPPERIRLFETSLPVRPQLSRPKITQCGRCFRYHRTETCSQSACCGVCASRLHTTPEHEHVQTTKPLCGALPSSCLCPPKCANCNGPHSAMDVACPARPKTLAKLGTISRLTRTQLRSLRQANGRIWAHANTCLKGKLQQNSQPSDGAPQAPETPSTTIAGEPSLALAANHHSPNPPHA